MHKLLLLCALAAYGSCSGCSMMVSGARTLVLEPLSYCAPKDISFATIRNRKLAERAWKDMVAQTPEQEFSEHYEDGFKDGYCDYLLFGGPGNPPAVPPRRYWRRYYESPEGHVAIGQWYSGFAQGASMAQGSGNREFFTVPSSLGPPPSAGFGSAPMPLPGLPFHPTAPPVEEVPPPVASALPQQNYGLATNYSLPTSMPNYAMQTGHVSPLPLAPVGPQGMHVGYFEPQRPLPLQSYGHSHPEGGKR